MGFSHNYKADYLNKSCNKGKELPDLMTEEDWKLYKNKLKNEKSNNLPKTNMGE